MPELLNADVYAPYFEVEIEGKPLPSTAVISVSVDENLEEPGKFEITFNENLDIETQQFTWLESPLINPGNKVKIYMGYAHKKSKQKDLFISGTIKALTPSFQSSGIPGLTVEGYDQSHNMQKKMTGFNGNEVKYSDIVKEIAGKYGLNTSKVDDSGKKEDKVERKKGEKDYAMLRRIANNLNFEFFVRGDKLYFRKSNAGKKKKVVFEFQKNLLGFNPRLSMASLVNKVEVSGWDEKAKKKIKESVTANEVTKSSDTADILKKFIKASEGTDPKIVETRSINTRDDAKKKAEVELKKSLNSFIEGSLECVGDPELRAGENIEIKGIGKLFSGDYYIKTARHSFDDSGYKATLEVRRNVL